MLKEIETHREQIAELCRRYGVKRLELFGSAARGHDFDPAKSDIDFLVEFDPEKAATLAEYFDLKQELSRLLGHPVDLVAPAALDNPYLRASVNKARDLIYDC